MEFVFKVLLIWASRGGGGGRGKSFIVSQGFVKRRKKNGGNERYEKRRVMKDEIFNPVPPYSSLSSTTSKKRRERKKKKGGGADVPSLFIRGGKRKGMAPHLLIIPFQSHFNLLEIGERDEGRPSFCRCELCSWRKGGIGEEIAFSFAYSSALPHSRRERKREEGKKREGRRQLWHQKSRGGEKRKDGKR